MLYIIFALGCTREMVEPLPPQAEELVEEVQEEEEPQNNPPEIQQIRFTDEKPTAHKSLRVEVTAHDADDDRIRYDYEWRVNGKKFGTESRAFLPSSRFHKGDTVEVTVIAQDREDEHRRTISTQILNTAPKWKMDPRDVKQIDGYQVQAEDADHDLLTYSLEGAPEGMTIDEKTGVLSYKGSKEAKKGAYNVHVLASDTDGAFVKWSFGIEVR